MRRSTLLAAALALAAPAAYPALGRDPGGPFPSAAQLRTNGFAAWPVDTVEEAEEECAGAEEWRLDARATALRFAANVLRYPAPYTSDWSDEQEHRERFLVGSKETRDVFLGSILELARFGRCWYVTGGTPREGDIGATLGFVYRGDRPNLLLGNASGLPSGFVGYGDWKTEIEPRLRQTVMWMPELDPGATGHAIYTRPDEQGVSEIVGIETFGSVPPGPSGAPPEPLGPAEAAADPAVCHIESSRFETPERVIRYLYQWTFDDLLRQVDGYPRYERKRFRHLGGDRWRLVVDDAVLSARIPDIANRCYQLVAMAPVNDGAPLRRLWIDDRGVTFGLDWGDADEAAVSVDGVSATLDEIDEPVTFPRHGEPPEPGTPMYARVILYDDGHVVSAYYGLYRADG